MALNTQGKTLMTHKTALALAAWLAVLATAPAQAVSTGLYFLNNHPDGAASPPPYGLRLDGLLTGDTNEIYTFDFDAPESSMFMSYDGAEIRIFGSALGGQDAGAAGYVGGTVDVWDLDFSYSVGLSQPGTDGGLADVFVFADNQNFGTLIGTGTLTSSLGSFELEDQSVNGLPSALAFQLGDENGAGHRGFAGISGWGWLNHGTDCIAGDCTHIYDGDWLFTATIVPVPPAVFLFGSALGLLGWVRRRTT